MILLQKQLLLASNSPRRKQLLADAGFEFDVEVIPTDESFPQDIDPKNVSSYISREKAEFFQKKHAGRLVLTADTVVIAGQHILAKPGNAAEAFEMIKMLSGNRHEVVTAVSLLHGDHIETVSDTAQVYFRKLEDVEINYYIDNYKPFDKAGSYGIQEWIGMIGIERIEGSFYTIMGLPVHIVYNMLRPFFRR